MTFVERVLNELEYQGKTKSELADYCGLTRSAFSMWITRNSIPAADTALKVARFLNVSVEYLIDGVEKDQSAADKCVLQIIELLKNFNPADKVRILKIVECFQSLEEKDKQLYVQMLDLLIRNKSPVNASKWVR